MSSIEVTGVPDFTKDRDQWFHHGSPESGKPSSESTFYFIAIEIYLDAIPLPHAGRVNHPNQLGECTSDRPTRPSASLAGGRVLEFELGHDAGHDEIAVVE